LEALLVPGQNQETEFHAAFKSIFISLWSAIYICQTSSSEAKCVSSLQLSDVFRFLVSVSQIFIDEFLSDLKEISEPIDENSPSLQKSLPCFVLLFQWLCKNFVTARILSKPFWKSIGDVLTSLSKIQSQIKSPHSETTPKGLLPELDEYKGLLPLDISTSSMSGNPPRYNSQSELLYSRIQYVLEASDVFCNTQVSRFKLRLKFRPQFYTSTTICLVIRMYQLRLLLKLKLVSTRPLQKL
jgi:hypothetical protein